MNPESRVTDQTHCRICGKYLGAGYLCDDCDDIIINRQHNPTPVSEEFTFYFGAASGSSRKALRELQEPNIMINYATKLNEPWWGIDRLFVDSGGYSFMKGKGVYATTGDEYLTYVEEHDPELFALRDYPCEPEVLEAHGRTVVDHQFMTLVRHCSLLSKLPEYDITAQPVAVLQGWDVDDYLRHIEAMKAAGVLTEVVGIGSVCRRHREAEIREVILAVRDALPGSIRLHAFGVKGSVLKYPDVRDALSSADSQSYEKRAQWGALYDLDAGNRDWQDSALEYLNQRRRIKTILTGNDDGDTEQQTLQAVADGGITRGEEVRGGGE